MQRWPKNKNWNDMTSPLSGLCHIHSYGPKREIGVGAAATTVNRTDSASLPKVSSIFEAGTHPNHLYHIYHLVK